MQAFIYNSSKPLSYEPIRHTAGALIRLGEVSLEGHVLIDIVIVAVGLRGLIQLEIEYLNMFCRL